MNKSLETKAEKRELNRKHSLMVTKSQEELFEKAKQDLPEILDQRLNKICEELSNITFDEDGNKKVSPAVIYEWIKAPFYAPTKSKYSAEEIMIILDTYTKVIAELNKDIIYLPTKENFCIFCGITTTQFNLWLKDIDHPERANAMKMVDNYITDMQQSLAQLGAIKETSTMFRMRAEHGMVEARAPQEIKVEHEVSQSQILEQMEAIKQGKSLKMLELNEDEDGIFRGN